MAIAPHADWNGTAGTGYSNGGGAGVAEPTEATRTTYRPAGWWMIPESQPRFVDSYLLQVGADGSAGSVKFYCEGVTETVSTITLFADGTFGYQCEIDTSSELTDGGLSVFAEIIPTDGSAQNQLLGPITIWTNSNGTLDNTGTVFFIDSVSGNATAAGTTEDPYDTMENLVAGEAAGLDTANNWSGVEIRFKSATGNSLRVADLTAGVASTLDGELIVTYDPVTQSNRSVTIDIASETGTRVEVRNLRVKGLKIDQGILSIFRANVGLSADYVYEDCLFQGDGTSTNAPVGNGGNWYLIDCDAVGWLANSPAVNSRMVRNFDSSGGTGDIFTGALAVFGSTITTHTQSGGQHVDFTQFESPSSTAVNRILMNVQSLGQGGQGLFLTETTLGTAMTDWAFVNCVVDTAASQINWAVSGVRMYFCTMRCLGGFSLGPSVPMKSIPVTGMSGTFNAGATVTGGTSGVTATIPLAVDETGLSFLYFTSPSGTFTNGETVTENAGEATCVIAGTESYVSEGGNNVSYGNYFLELTGDDETFLEANWTFNYNAYESAITWKPGTNSNSVSDPFIDSATLDFSPSGMPKAALLASVPYDANGATRVSLTSMGALEEIVTANAITSDSGAAALLI